MLHGHNETSYLLKYLSPKRCTPGYMQIVDAFKAEELKDHEARSKKVNQEAG